MTAPEIYRWCIRCKLDRHPCEDCNRPLDIGDDAVQIDGEILCPACAAERRPTTRTEPAAPAAMADGLF